MYWRPREFAHRGDRLQYWPHDPVAGAVDDPVAGSRSSAIRPSTHPRRSPGQDFRAIGRSPRQEGYGRRSRFMGRRKNAHIGMRYPQSRASSPPRRRRVSRKRRAPKIERRRLSIMRCLAHAGLALTTGLLCGTAAARVGHIVSPPYAAILGTLIIYPILTAIWWRLPLRAMRR